MAEDISDLVVRVHPEGMDETQQGLEDVSETFGETADDVGESADEFGTFARRFSGAGLVFAGVFGTMVAAVASKMPILEESAGAFDAVLTALGLKMDKTSRGPMSEFNRTMFRTSERILEAEGPLEAIDVAFEGFRRSVLRALTTLVTGEPTIEQFVSKLLQGFGVDIPAAMENFRRGIRGFERFFHENLVMPIVLGVRRVLRALNKLPGPNVGLPNIPAPPRAPGTPAVPETGGGEDFLSASGQEAAVRQALATGTVQTEVNIDSRKVGESTKPFVVRGVLSKRGLPGE